MTTGEFRRIQQDSERIIRSIREDREAARVARQHLANQQRQLDRTRYAIGRARRALGGR